MPEPGKFFRHVPGSKSPVHYRFVPVINIIFTVPNLGEYSYPGLAMSSLRRGLFNWYQSVFKFFSLSGEVWSFLSNSWTWLWDLISDIGCVFFIKCCSLVIDDVDNQLPFREFAYQPIRQQTLGRYLVVNITYHVSLLK